MSGNLALDFSRPGRPQMEDAPAVHSRLECLQLSDHESQCVAFAVWADGRSEWVLRTHIDRVANGSPPAEELTRSCARTQRGRIPLVCHSAVSCPWSSPEPHPLYLSPIHADRPEEGGPRRQLQGAEVDRQEDVQGGAGRQPGRATDLKLSPEL